MIISFVVIFQVISVRLAVGKRVFSTHGKNVLASEDREYISGLVQCNQEEAYPLIMIHVLDGRGREIIRNNGANIDDL